MVGASNSGTLGHLELAMRVLRCANGSNMLRCPKPQTQKQTPSHTPSPFVLEMLQHEVAHAQGLITNVGANTCTKDTRSYIAIFKANAIPKEHQRERAHKHSVMAFTQQCSTSKCLFWLPPARFQGNRR